MHVPSAAAHLDGTDLKAFSFDRAVWTFGRAVEQDMDAAEQQMSRGKKKPNPKLVHAARQRVLDAYLAPKARDEEPTATTGRFRDPASSVNRRRR
jgi:hypothetical protein